jgi:hypothetical protein
MRRDEAEAAAAEAAGEETPDDRHVCEAVHRAMKRWVVFSVFGLRSRAKESRMQAKFLCVQLLSTLLKRCVGKDVV